MNKDIRNFHDVFVALNPSEKVELYYALNKKCGTSEQAVKAWAYLKYAPVNPIVRKTLIDSLKKLFGVTTDFETLFPKKEK